MPQIHRYTDKFLLQHLAVNFSIQLENEPEELLPMHLSDYLSIATIVAAISATIAVFALWRQIRQQNLQSFYYIHQYLSLEEFRSARHLLRTKQHGKSISDLAEPEYRQAANAVCASYDQAGILITIGGIDRNSRELFLSSSWGESVCDHYEMLASYLDTKQTPQKSGREFFRHFTDLYKQACVYHRQDSKSKVIRSDKI